MLIKEEPLDEALGRFEAGEPLESDEAVVVLTEDDPQWNACNGRS